VALHRVSHPLVEDVLARLRDKETSCDEFRRLARRLSLLIAVEATKDLATREVDTFTPLERARVRTLATRVVAVPVLRAGLGMLDAFLELVPSAQVGYFGLERNEETAVARRYYEKVPRNLATATVFLLDPMLATGGSAIAAIDVLKRWGAVHPVRIKLVNLIAAPEGVEAVTTAHPDVEIYCAALDRQLNGVGYIMPGLGDAGDRQFGTGKSD
jgi:uracil phosphoribosyltransferase